MVLIGLVVGFLIGLTGIGSGSLLTPLLILFGGLAPAPAVGTSLFFSFLTKLSGSLSFYRNKMVDMEIVRDLSIGGLPGVLAGAFVIRYIGLRKPDVMNVFLLRSIGAVLIVVALLMLVRLLPHSLRPAAADRRLEVSPGLRRAVIIVVGFAVGISVTITSIGSGAALIPAMVLFYRLNPGTLVGTNVVMGTFMAGIAAIPHFGLGNIRWDAVVGLLCGSVPAVWFASQLHGRIPRQIPEGIIALGLLAMGIRIFAI